MFSSAKKFSEQIFLKFFMLPIQKLIKIFSFNIVARNPSVERAVRERTVGRFFKILVTVGYSQILNSKNRFLLGVFWASSFCRCGAPCLLYRGRVADPDPK